MEFEASTSFTYHFARYVILPALLDLPEVKSGEPFLLRELAWPLIDGRLSPQQQSTKVKRAQADGMISIGQSVRYYVPFIAKNTGMLTNVGNGVFRLPSEADLKSEDLLNAAIDDEEDSESSEFDGHVYAFSFPSIVKAGQAFPIKIGKTVGDVAARIQDQCKGSASFENPVILGSWAVQRVGPTELAIHNVLKARGKWRENAPGREWFDTTMDEVSAIVKFVTAV